MCSREMYMAKNHLGSLIKWESEYVHFGTGIEVKTDLIKQLIENHPDHEKLLFIYGRNTSGQFMK
jgi:hypothetical protein